jgi:hypothetical protein
MIVSLHKLKMKGFGAHMRKRLNLHILELLLVLVVALAGCGGGGGGGNDDGNEMVTFKMPGEYYDYTNVESGLSTVIPSGRSIKFYTIKSKNESDLTITIDHTFSGTTGSSGLSFTLPNDLIGQDRFIYAIVNLNLTGSFELKADTTIEKIKDAIESGQILFGKASISARSMEDKSVTLTKGGTVEDFTFIGKINPTAASITFKMPSQYYTSQDYSNSTDIPSGKTVVFYVLTDKNQETLDALSPFSRTTGGELNFILPNELIGQKRYIYAVVFRDKYFKLTTQTDLLEAYNNGQVLFGKATASESAKVFDAYEYPLFNGCTIGEFIFIGKP